MTEFTRAPVATTTLRILLLAAVYWITGHFSLLLAIPPGFVTGLFLPLGIALGAVLIWGTPMLLGVLLGSALLNISVALIGGQPFSLSVVLIATEIAFGSALASFAGAVLIRHYVGFPEKLTDERKIFAFFILGGPVATSLSASCGVLVLYLNDIIHFKHTFFTWWTWWIGDAIGVLIATPLMCVLFAEPRHAWHGRRYTVGMPMVVSSLVVVVVFVFASHNEQRKLEDQFAQQADLISRTVESRLSAVAFNLATLRGLFVASNEVTRDEFAAYVGNVMPGVQGVNGFAWNQQVSSEQRAEYETQMRAQGHPGFVIKEFLPNGQQGHAPVRDKYIVITYVEPWQENDELVGLNISVDPMRAATQERARDTGALAMTGPLELYNDGADKQGVIVFQPVYRPGVTTATAVERQQALVGYATAIVRITELMAPVLETFPPSRFEIDVRDITDIANPALFFSSVPTASSSYAHTLGSKYEFGFGGRHLMIKIMPSETYLLEHRSLQSWFVLAGGLLFCSFLGGFLLLITGRTQHVRDLVDQRTKELTAILENAVESILVVDEQGYVLRANPAAEYLFGYRFNAGLGVLFGELVPSIKPFFSYASQTAESIQWREAVGIHASGKNLPIELSLSPVVLADRKFFTVIVHDASAKQKVDKLKSEFISTVSHELRTPLTSIKGALGLVLSGELGELEGRMKDLLVIANHNADRLTRLVNDILDIDKLEFGKAEMVTQEVLLYPLLQQSIIQNQGYSTRYGVELVLDPVDESLQQLWVNLDTDRFLQIMSNLISNAIKYSHLGGRVRVGLERSGAYARVLVVDQGQGIPEEFRQRIFHKFAQADSSDTRRRDGTGLGLSITKALVERLGGKIDYQSVEGEGTTFFFTLPIVEPGANEGLGSP